MRQALFLVSFVFICGLHSGAQQKLDLPTLIPFKQRGNFGFKTQSNQVLIPPIYKNVGLFVNGKAIVSKKIKGKRWSGIIDTTGKEIVPVKYTLCYFITNEGRGFVASNFIAPNTCFTIVKDGDKFINNMGIWDRNGDVVLEPEYVSIVPYYHNRIGMYFLVKKRIGSDEKIAVYNTLGDCLMPLADTKALGEWEVEMLQAKKSRNIPTKEDLLRADTTKSFTYINGLEYRGFEPSQAIVMNKKTKLYGVYNLATNTYELTPNYRHIAVLGNGQLICTLPDKKAKRVVYNSSFLVIDSLDNKIEFIGFWGSQFGYTNYDVVYSGNYKPLNQPGYLRPIYKHFPRLGLALVIDKNLNTAAVFDTLGNRLFQQQLSTKYLYDIHPLNNHVEQELKEATSLDSVQMVLRIAFAPLAEMPITNNFGLSYDGQMYYGLFMGKLSAIPASEIENFPMIQLDGINKVFEFINGKKIPLPKSLRYLLLFGTDSMYAATHITSPTFYQVDKTGKLRLLEANERLVLIERLNAGVDSVINNCALCKFKQPYVPDQNWQWDYQALSSDALNISLPNLVPQANPSSAKLDLSKGQHIFFHRTTLQVFGIYKKYKRIHPTPYYALFRVNRKNGDLKNYVIRTF